jgi:hypothetical protein
MREVAAATTTDANLPTGTPPASRSIGPLAANAHRVYADRRRLPQKGAIGGLI